MNEKEKWFVDGQGGMMKRSSCMNHSRAPDYHIRKDENGE